ncbi:hypothetical protein BDK51DRAFT_33369, partial [Blyttiomyces helicus]
EVMRCAGITTLLYPVNEVARRDAGTKRIVVRELVPVQRRREIQFPNNLRDGENVPPSVLCNMQMLTTALLYEPKIVVNTRIVVVGGSDTGVAYLEKLVYSSHLHFTNLTLISTDGVPEIMENSPYVSRRCYTRVELKQTGLDHYVRIIRSTTKEFDRVLKRVKLSNGSYVAYDYLILTPGMQFDASTLHETLAETYGVFPLNRNNHAELSDAVGIEAASFSAPLAMVYGRDLQAYAGVQFLISRGYSPERIVLAIPPLRLPSSCFDNPVVENMVHKTLQDLGVKLLVGYRIIEWEDEKGSLSAVTVKSKEARATQNLTNLTLLLYADETSVARETFRSINDSCLVFDGRLVIDKYFRTQDPFIYAAGSITKFSSRYETKWIQEFYDSREVGRKLADFMLPFFDPTCLPQPMKDNTELLAYHDAKKGG